MMPRKKAARVDGLVRFRQNCAGLRLGSRGFFGLYDCLLALEVGLAAAFLQVFIVLFSHNCCLYFRRWLRFGVPHYEFL